MSDGDLHTRKDSHIAAPAGAGIEWHLKKEDVTIPTKVDGAYMVTVPVIKTSEEGDSHRFRQIAKPFVQKGPVFDKETQKKHEAGTTSPISKSVKGASVDWYNSGKKQ